MKKYIFLFFLILSVSSNSFAASSGSSNNSLSNYDKAAKLIDEAKKYEKNGKVKKANKRYKRALKYLVQSDKEKPNIPDTLNYLGFVTRKLGDYINGEKYYLKGLAIDPTHVGINEYLGELYVVTNKMDMAIKRLEVLEKCNCNEYKDLKEIIEGKKESKY